MSSEARRKPFKLAAAIASEDELHASVAKALDLLLLPPAIWTTFPSGGYGLTPAAAARLYRLGLKVGWPDILLVHRSLFGIELKRIGATLSRTRLVRSRAGNVRLVEGQRDVHPKLLAAGFTAIAVCDSVPAVLRQVEAWDVPLRGWR